MRIKSVIDAASGVYACGASHLNLHHTNAYHPRHRETPQTLFYLHPPITQKHRTITPAYGHQSKQLGAFPVGQCDRGGNIPPDHPLDKPRNVWYNIAVVSSRET